MKRGYIQVYTGNGKGKTTAAIGLAARALGAGLSVCFVQFIKGSEYSEIRTLKKLGVPIHQFGRGRFIMGKPSDQDKELAVQGLAEVRDLVTGGGFDLIVLDEVNVALDLGVLEVADVLDILRSKPDGLEIVCTGRNAPKELMEAADLVTEMREVKHYYNAGVPGRKGIES
jgi:cob(I)alamin adenosyltransferase